MRREVLSTNAEQTRQLGAALGLALMSDDLATARQQPIVIFLRGELGAGKTTFVGGLLQSIGVKGPVRSPTYTLIEPYELSTLYFYHMDLYRVAVAGELEMLALKDILQPNTVLLVEWAERAEAALPKPDLIVSLSYPQTIPTVTSHDDQDRLIDIESRTSIGACLYDKL